jgi:ABC-type polysaccharide/polyol phosphate export permease
LELFYYPLQKDHLDRTGIMISAGVALVFLVAGLLYFKKTEVYFADLI